MNTEEVELPSLVFSLMKQVPVEPTSHRAQSHPSNKSPLMWLLCDRLHMTLAFITTSTRNISVCLLKSRKPPQLQTQNLSGSYCQTVPVISFTQQYQPVARRQPANEQNKLQHIWSKVNESLQKKNTWCLIHLRFVFCSFTPFYAPGKCDCVRSHSD